MKEILEDITDSSEDVVLVRDSAPYAVITPYALYRQNSKNTPKYQSEREKAAIQALKGILSSKKAYSNAQMDSAVEDYYNNEVA